jgi:hypothetical protein
LNSPTNKARGGQKHAGARGGGWVCKARRLGLVDLGSWTGPGQRVGVWRAGAASLHEGAVGTWSLTKGHSERAIFPQSPAIVLNTLVLAAPPHREKRLQG